MIDVETAPANFDDHVDATIEACLDPANPQSFFLYAGAGSGKTRSLKNALDAFRANHGAGFRRVGKKIAVITYTNAAADEIAERVGEDALFPISTIHSFCWKHIQTFHTDIQAWLLAKLPEDLADLHEKQAKGRAGTKAAQDRERAIASTMKRLEWLSVPRRFTYNPNGDNFGTDSLSHSEVLKITAAFIETKPSMQAVLVNKYPFLLIDESQDTNKGLLEAFFTLAAANVGKFAIGLFCDSLDADCLDCRREEGIKFILWILHLWEKCSPVGERHGRGDVVRKADIDANVLEVGQPALHSQRFVVAEVFPADSLEKRCLAGPAGTVNIGRLVGRQLLCLLREPDQWSAIGMVFPPRRAKWIDRAAGHIRASNIQLSGFAS